MKLVCRDCKTSTLVTDKYLKLCPQCGSINIDIMFRNSIIDKELIQDRPRNAMAKVKILFGIMGINGLFLVIIGSILLSIGWSIEFLEDPDYIYRIKYFI